MTQQLVEAAAPWPRIRFILRDPMPFHPRLMHSPEHLLAPAAKRYTRRLVGEIRAASLAR